MNTLIPTTAVFIKNFTSTTQEPEYSIGHTLSKSFANFVASCFIIIILTSVFCNAVLIYKIITVKNLHSVTHVFIVNLAVSDLITVLGTVPFDVEFMLRGYFPYGSVPCGIMTITFLISLPSSVLNLTLLTAERFISVSFPFRRIQFLTKWNISIAVVSTWSYTFLVAFFPLMYDKNAILVEYGHCFLIYPQAYDIFQLVANFAIPIIFICYANAILFCVSRKHAIQISKTMKGLGTFVDTATNKAEAKKKKKRYTSVHHNIKAAKRIALLVSVFLFCWLFYIILVATNLSCNICHPRELTWIGNIINYSASAINPLLYGMLNKKIRYEVMKTVYYLFSKIGKQHNFYPSLKRDSAGMLDTTTLNVRDRLLSFNENNNDITSTV